ncbi:hypothetical protein ABBQ32_14186 [Trebouxia sp. C0010 RCD-2024]
MTKLQSFDLACVSCMQAANLQSEHNRLQAVHSALEQKIAVAEQVLPPLSVKIAIADTTGAPVTPPLVLHLCPGASCASTGSSVMLLAMQLLHIISFCMVHYSYLFHHFHQHKSTSSTTSQRHCCHPVVPVLAIVCAWHRPCY